MQEKDYINLFIENQKLIYRFINDNKKYYFLFDTKEDMIQELSLILWKKIKSYKDKYSFSTFANLIFSHYCKTKVLKYYRRKKRKKFEEINECCLTKEENNSIENMEDESCDLIELLSNDIEYEQMSDYSKDILNGYTYNEVKKRNHIGIDRLYKELEKDAESILKRRSLWK